MCLEQHQASLDLSVPGAHFATRGHSSRGMRGSPGNHSFGHGYSSEASRLFRGWGHGSSQHSGHGFPSNSSQSNRPVCQVCNRFAHVALDCYNWFNESYSRESSPQAHAYLSALSSSSDRNWYPDSGGTHHLTPDLDNLNIKVDDYMGLDQIRISKSKGLSIKYIGTTSLSTTHSQFDLHDILHVP
jgi:hypothetical protein